jgi:hypothetical protein
MFALFNDYTSTTIVMERRRDIFFLPICLSLCTPLPFAPLFNQAATVGAITSINNKTNRNFNEWIELLTDVTLQQKMTFKTQLLLFLIAVNKI